MIYATIPSVIWVPFTLVSSRHDKWPPAKRNDEKNRPKRLGRQCVNGLATPAGGVRDRG
jgi:hypothetical protein